MRIVTGVGDLVQRTWDGPTGQVLSGRTIGWRRVWSTPYTWRQWAWVSLLSLKTNVDGLSIVWPQNHWDGFLRFVLKTGGDGFLRSGLKTSGDGLSPFGLKTGSSGFLVWASKSTATVWWFGSQNYRDGFLVWVLKPSRRWFIGCASKPKGWCDGVGHALRSSDLFHVKESRARVF
jgi:hypothetical protein